MGAVPTERSTPEMSAKELTRRALLAMGLNVHWIRKSMRPDRKRLPDHDLYAPIFEPWRAPGEFKEIYENVKALALVGPDRAHVLYSLARQALALDGEVWECGVYRGGSALLLAELLRRNAGSVPRPLRLFDTFTGMPEVDSRRDLHRGNDFADTSVESLRARFSSYEFASLHPGLIPASFGGLEHSRIAFAHADVDLYRSTMDTCAFIYPRLVPGGFMVFDDYGFASCPGARQAVDDFFQGKPEIPLVLSTGQAVVFRAPEAARREPSGAREEAA